MVKKKKQEVLGMGKCKTKKTQTKKTSRKPKKKLEKTKKEKSRGLGGRGVSQESQNMGFTVFFFVFSKCLTFLHGALPKESRNIDLFAVFVFNFIVKYKFAHMFHISRCTACLICV